MAQRNGSGRGATATKTRSRNETPNTPEIRESEIARMRVEDIRSQLKERGVSGTSGQRKDELVKTLAKTLRTERRGAKPAAAKKAPAGRKAAAPAKKGAAAAKKTAVPSRKGATAAKRVSTAGAGGGGARQGKAGSRSLKYAQRISSPDDQPERPGRSLVTTDRRVIQRWAEARNAQPATIEGTEREGRPGVLTFDFPGWRSGGRLKPITWEEWFGTFDLRRLNFIYQEQMTNQRQSNFFRLESPEREDA